jgi:hypothetical protein
MKAVPERSEVARGVSQLAFDAVEQLSRVVEAMHANIAAAPLPLGRGPEDGRTRGVTGFVYASIRLVNGAARTALDSGLSRLPRGKAEAPGRRADALRAALNGVLGDHLAATGNPLALPMQLRSEGRALPLEREALAAALPAASSRLLVLVHGLCMSDRGFRRRGHDHGAALATALGHTPLYLLYNSGRPIAENGRDLAELLEALLAAWPVRVDELVILGHSMGGLVARSACEAAAETERAWLGRLAKLVFLGTPHHGAPLERAGRWLEGALGLSPYVAPIARLGALRSAGIGDLAHGSSAPLPAGVACYAVAGTLGPDPLGDGLVPLASALGQNKDPARVLAFPAANRLVARGLGHFDLLDDRAVAERLRAWLA